MEWGLQKINKKRYKELPSNKQYQGNGKENDKEN